MQRRMACSFSVLKTTTADVIENKNTDRQAVRRHASYVAVSTVETDMVGTFGIWWAVVACPCCTTLDHRDRFRKSRANLFSFAAMRTERHHCAAVCFGAQPAPVAVRVATARGRCESDAVSIICQDVRVSSAGTTTTDGNPWAVHHARPSLRITAEINRESRAVLTVHYGKVVFGLPVVGVGERDHTVMLKNATHKIHHVPENLAGAGQLRQVGPAVLTRSNVPRLIFAALN